VTENSDRGYAEITVLRDVHVFDGPVTLEYATSDLTARGIDSTQFEFCIQLPVKDRAANGCGDYEQTRGLMHIAAGDDRGTFTVNIVNDLCQERFMKYVEVSCCCCSMLCFFRSDSGYATTLISLLYLFPDLLAC
jgi:hypothetical protein